MPTFSGSNKCKITLIRKVLGESFNKKDISLQELETKKISYNCLEFEEEEDSRGLFMTF